jgi:outer membrane protein TolC
MKLLIGFIIAFVLFFSSLSFSQDINKMSLDDCIAVALKNNTSIVAAQSYSKMAEAGLKSARGEFMPSIDAVSQWQRQNKDQYNIRFDQLVVSKESYYYRFGLSQPIFTGMRNFFNLKMNKADRDYYRNSLLWTQQLVVLEVKLNYYNVLKAIQLLKIAEETMKMSEEELNRIIAMEKAGVSSRAEVYQQKVQAGENKLLVIEARNGLSNARTQLNYVLGIDVTTPVELVADPTDMNVENQNIILDDAIDQSFENRPDFKYYQNKLDKSNANVKVQKSFYYPNLSFGANYSWWDVQFPEKKRDITEFDSYSYTLNLSMNIFSGFQTQASVSSAKAEVIAAEADLEQAKRQITLDVKKALLELEKATEKIAATKENITAAEEDYRLASERFRIGAGTLLDQNRAETSLSRAKMNHIQAMYDHKYASAALDLALGKLSR